MNPTLREPSCRRVLLVVSASLLLLGCGKLRAPSAELCPDFEAQIRPLTTASCDRCHSGAAAAGGYQTTSYPALVAVRDDGTPRLVPGAESSLFVSRVEGEAGHPALEGEQLTLVKAWVRCRAPGREFDYHPNGWGNPSDEAQFHGRALRQQAYSLDGCYDCHGKDLRGGKSKVSCHTCHTEGPLACNVCHGDAASPAPPRALDGARSTATLGVGAHRAHVTDGPLHTAYGCGVCHRDVADAGQERHYQNSGYLDPLPAEVRILAQSSPGLYATWTPEEATCGNVQCHAPSRDTRATRQAPKWTSVDGGQAACGTCHGLPPSSHAPTSTVCESCHPRVGTATRVVSPELHANGSVELGDGTASCSACHGDATSPAPPRDLLGRTDPALVTIGAHRAHLGASRFRGPIACDECHQVPTALRDPGHLDGLPAGVFPAVWGVGVLASTDSAQPAWSHAAGTCASVYCHGGGASAARDTSASINRTPEWTAGSAEVVCGSCHGLPPRDGFHATTLALTDCHGCHGAVIAADGGLKWETADAGVRQSRHLDGVVQLGAQ